MTRHNPSKLGYSVLDYFQCPKSKECANDQCFFRKRDVLGMNVWASAYWNMSKEKQKEQDKLWADMVWPDLKITPGTNCFNIYCKDEMLP